MICKCFCPSSIWNNKCKSFIPWSFSSLGNGLFVLVHCMHLFIQPKFIYFLFNSWEFTSVRKREIPDSCYIRELHLVYHSRTIIKPSLKHGKDLWILFNYKAILPSIVTNFSIEEVIFCCLKLFYMFANERIPQSLNFCSPML